MSATERDFDPIWKIAMESNSQLLAETGRKLEMAEKSRQAKQLDRAEALCRELLRKYPDYVGALQTIGLTLADMQKFEEACGYLARAASLNPKDWKILTALSGTYLRSGSSQMAAITLEQAQKLKPDDASILATLGEIYREEREYELAAETHERAYTIDPGLGVARIGYGHACGHLGRNSDAVDAYEKLISEGHNSINTVFSLSQLPTSLISIDLKSCIAGAKIGQRMTQPEFDNLMGFTKASYFDKAKDYDQAWKHLTEANRSLFQIVRKGYNGDAATRANVLQLLRKSPKREPLTKPEDSIISLFILGPSRSGKTTVERIAGNIGDIKRGFENPIVENAVRRTFQESGLITRQRLLELPPVLDPRFRLNYLEDLENRASGSKVFTNTHPGRIFDVYRLATAIPNSRFLFIKRQVDDVCLRIFMKKYQAGHLHSYDLNATREYVDWYYQMIDGLCELFPTITSQIRYEDMISSPETVPRTLQDLCGLPLNNVTIPSLGDDRGAAHPYESRMWQ